MITIIKNTVNRIVVTLSELTTIGAPLYLMEFISKDTRESKVLRLGTDTSFNVVRYNIFYISEVDESLEDLNIGLINLKLGAYSYSIYETTSSTSTNISNLNRVESGLVTVKDTGNTIINVGLDEITILDNDDSDTIITFN